MLVIAEYCNDMSRIDALEIEITKDEIYRSWWRLKLKNAPAATYRAIVEIESSQVTLHVVLSRGSRTYKEVKALWEKYRSKK